MHRLESGVPGLPLGLGTILCFTLIRPDCDFKIHLPAGLETSRVIVSSFCCSVNGVCSESEERMVCIVHPGGQCI